MAKELKQDAFDYVRNNGSVFGSHRSNKVRGSMQSLQRLFMQNSYIYTAVLSDFSLHGIFSDVTKYDNVLQC